ncbi:MAG TPA: clostripain-related cysteine peptidase [Candidatus Babeliales bacterium]|nr:clostripain-related cysteine peptidase [Candidatus Babeliales bacterium]
MKKVFNSSHIVFFILFAAHQFTHANTTNAISFNARIPLNNLEQQKKPIASATRAIHALNAPAGLELPAASPDQHITENQKRVPKEWTIMTYMAAVNDLAPYARKNLKQQSDVGSNARVNLITQLDTVIGAHNKVTKRYYIERDKLIVKNQNDPATQRMDSGSPETLIDFCGWAIQNYPAHNYMLILWNHGTGIIDIGRPRSINPVQLFYFNPETQLIELDRTIPFLDFVQATQDNDPRAICFDDITGHYISNQGLERALKEITQRFMGGKKFAIVAFDACLMSMLEVANIIKDYSQIMVSSQEVVLGPGYDYRRILSPVVEQSLNPFAYAKQIVSAYEQTYNTITNDYTQSALYLDKLGALEQNVHFVGLLLTECLTLQHGTAVRDVIKSARHKLLCTHFDEPSYLDQHHLYSNLLANLHLFKFRDEQKGRAAAMILRKHLQDGLAIINGVVIANATGKNLNQAKGISIYFPERGLHNSYHRTKFASKNAWFNFLTTYLAGQ